MGFLCVCFFCLKEHFGYIHTQIFVKTNFPLKIIVWKVLWHLRASVFAVDNLKYFSPFYFCVFQVSNGAECVLIKKSWFFKHANEATLRKLRNQVMNDKSSYFTFRESLTRPGCELEHQVCCFNNTQPLTPLLPFSLLVPYCLLLLDAT